MGLNMAMCGPTRMMVGMGVGAKIWGVAGVGRRTGGASKWGDGVSNWWRKGAKLEVRAQQILVRQGEGRIKLIDACI